MDPTNYQNYTWINLCPLVPIQKVLKPNPNSIIALTPNLIESFSTLWFFFWDTLVFKHHTWQIVWNLFNFYHSLHVWYHEIMRNLMIFRLRLLFLEFKNHSATCSWSCFLNKMFKISFHFPSKTSHWTQ